MKRGFLAVFMSLVLAVGLAPIGVSAALPPRPLAINHGYVTNFSAPLTVAAPGLLIGDTGSNITVTARRPDR